MSGASLTVLYRDEHIVAIDKPAGWLVIPGRGPPERTVREEAEALFGSVFVVHRLDRGTSGVLLLPLTRGAHRALNLAFDRREVRKVYLAVVRGNPPARQRIDIPLAPARRGRMRPARLGDPRAKDAATEIRLVEALPQAPGFPELSLVEAVPETGRTHQIRVHLRAAGCPLAIDPDYGEPGPLRAPDGRVLLDRTPLHASRLELRHPATGAPLVIEAPMPEDIAGILEALR